jgi:hemerythrin-like domain-containing protein
VNATPDKNPEDIEVEIDATRARLSDTLDELQARLSPRQRLNEAAQSMRASGEDLLQRSVRAVTPDITTMIRMDHTHVLMLFRRFRPHTSAGKKRALVTNACLALEVHAQLEEEIFYPALRRVVSSHPVLDKSVDEHDRMRKSIVLLRDLEPTDSQYETTFCGLMREVLHHVADEETTLLPLAERVLADELGTLGIEMTKRRVELLKPHLGEAVATSARSFPLAFGAAAASLVLLGWLAVRPRRH